MKKELVVVYFLSVSNSATNKKKEQNKKSTSYKAKEKQLPIKIVKLYSSKPSKAEKENKNTSLKI